jgi:tape measure domain-containing protein
MAANKKLTFIFALEDKVSGSANKMSKALKKLEVAMGDTGRSATKLSKGLAQITVVAKGVDRASRGIKGVKKETSGWSMALQGVEAGMSIFGRVSSMAYGVASAIGSIGVETVSAIAKIQMFGLEAADFKERTLIGFKTFLGDAHQAEELFKTAMDFARKTPFETQDTIDMFRQLATAGFKFNKNSLGVSEIEVAAKAIGDLTSVAGGGAEQIGRITKAFQQIKSKGKLRAEELTGQLGDTGVNISAVYKTLGKNLGKTRDEVEKLMRAGKIDADTGIFAIIEAMKQTTSGGTLGKPMDELSHTLTGLWSTIRSAPFEMLVDLDKTLGFKQAKGFFSNVQKALDPTSGPGKRVKAKLENMFDDMFGFTFSGLSGEKGAEQMGMFLENLIDTVGKVGKALGSLASTGLTAVGNKLRELGGGDIGKGIEVMFTKAGEFAVSLISKLEKLAEKAGYLVDVVVNAKDVFNEITDTPDFEDPDFVDNTEAGQFTPPWMDKLKQATKVGYKIEYTPHWSTELDPRDEEGLDRATKAFEFGNELGKNLGMGFEVGIKNNMGYWDAAGYAMEYANKKAAEAAGIKSPSKVFEYFGLMTAKGFEQGIEAGQGSAEDKVRDLMAARGAAFDTSSEATPSLPSAGLSSGAISIGNVSVTVQTGPQSDPQATAAAVAEILPEALLEAIERINMETGV